MIFFLKIDIFLKNQAKMITSSPRLHEQYILIWLLPTKVYRTNVCLKSKHLLSRGLWIYIRTVYFWKYMVPSSKHMNISLYWHVKLHLKAKMFHCWWTLEIQIFIAIIFQKLSWELYWHPCFAGCRWEDWAWVL